MHERYSLDVVTEALFAAIHRLWDRLSPRVDLLKKRSEKVGEITSLLSSLKIPQLGIEAAAPVQEAKKTLNTTFTRR